VIGYNTHMQVTPLKTHKITTQDTDILKILDRYITELQEKSVVAVTSKIVSICEGRVVPIESTDRNSLVEQESELYLPPDENQYGFSIAVRHSSFIASGGVDESNGNGQYILWPEDPQKSANLIRAHLRNKFNLKNLGVIITDSKTTPLRWGVTGFAITHSGFNPLNNLIGKPDLFGRAMHVTKVNVMDGLAAAAVYVMGEANEQTPLATLTDMPHIVFQDNDPTPDELAGLHISLEEDIYAPIFKRVPWKKGKRE